MKKAPVEPIQVRVGVVVFTVVALKGDDNVGIAGGFATGSVLETHSTMLSKIFSP